MRRIAPILAFIFLMVVGSTICGHKASAQSYSLPNSDSGCPANCRQIPWQTGSDVWNGGTLPTYTGVTCTGLHNDGSTDDGPGIQACINSLSSGQAAVIPAGTKYYVNSTVRLKSNTVLRGAQAQGGPPFLPTASSGETRIVLGSSGYLTTQNFSFTGGSLYPPTSYGSSSLPNTCTLSGTPQKGTTSLTSSSADSNCKLSAGTWIIVYGNDDLTLATPNGEDGFCQWCGMNQGAYVQTQIVQVTGLVSGSGGSGSVFNISKPLYYTPQTAPQTVTAPNGSGTVTEPAGAKYTIINFPTQKAGYENLRVDGSQHDTGANRLILLQGCLECWVKNVETYDTGSNSLSAHVETDMSYGAEIRDSAFHDQRSGASGAGYGIYFQFVNSDHKVENNIVYHSRHGLIMQGGGSGIAWLYNYDDDGYTDDLTYFASSRTSHGAHPFFSLYEGNIIKHMTADDFSGTSSHHVFFRNWIRGGEPNFDLGSGPIGSFPPDGGFNAVDLYEGQTYYSFVDNVLGNPGISLSLNLPGLLSISIGLSGTWQGGKLNTYNRYSGPSTPTVYSMGGGLTYGGANVPSSAATMICQGNYDYLTNGVASTCGTTGNTYQASYYYTAKPSFLGGCAFPAQGSDLSSKGSLQQPAYQRATGGSCSGSPAAPQPPAPINVIGTVVQ